MIERHYRRWVKPMAWLGVVLAVLYFGVGHYYRLAFNTSDSLPGHVFLIIKGVLPERGDIVAFSPPEQHLLISDAVLSKAPFLKRAFGVPGDQVRIQSSFVFVDQHYVGRVLPQSRDGRPLYPIENGVIPEKHYFMGTYHERSYDSRYQSIGLVSAEQIMGRAYRLF